MLNEVSQGATGGAGTAEYVELIVVGSPTCTTVPCFDLRGYYLDDNNGAFATGSGVGIASGCIRLTTNALWSCVPAGTIIVIYNDADPNVNLPAQDLSMSDGNCRLIIPGGNTTLLERNSSTPSTSISTYPTAGFGTGSSWNAVAAMANGGDSFQSRDASGNLLSAVSWGNNSTSTIIYFSGSQSGKVCNNLNTADNNPNNQANWGTANVAGNETPGLPNNAANAAWISSMNFSCGSLIPTGLTATVTSTNAGCTCTGSATVTASGGVAPYTYAWAPSGGNAAIASNLCAGNYSVTVTSTNGCVQTVTVNIASVSTVSASIASTNISCNGSTNGSATVTAISAVAPVTYTWSSGGGNAATASNLSPGNYSVTLTDANNCTATATTTISQPPTLSVSILSTDVLCNGGSTGAATLTVAGGTAGYTYTWSPSGGNAATATNLAQGTYSIHILDAHLCVKDTQVTITQPPPITATLTSTASTCGLANGSATAVATGGTGTLNYTWTPTGGNASTASNLPGGTYTVTITDGLACSLSNTVTVQQFLSPVLSVSTSSVLCNGGNTGTATSTITSGGTPAYTYTWAPSGGNSSSATSLTVGNYTLFVTDANGCKDTAYANITEPTPITATLTSTPATCGNNNGTTTSIVNGGVGAYTYTWTPNGGNGSIANNLAPGNYSLTISDANACTYSTSVNLGNKPSPVLSVTSNSVACFGANTGNASITINTGTGTAPFTYSWSPVGGSTPSLNNLPAGNYTVLVSDSAHCTATATISINQPVSPLTVTITSTAATCNHTDGTANVVVAGGTSPYTNYAWSPTGGSSSTATNLAGNTSYTCTITDANTCTVSAQTTIAQNASISLTLTSTPATCGLTNGTTNVTASGGIPGRSGYTYTWTPSGGNTSSATNLAGNTIYTVSVSDSVGCSISKSINVGNKPSPVLSITSTSISCNNANTGSASVNINPGTGTAPFTYSWSPVNGNNSTINNLPAGNYTVLVTDSANCTATATTSIAQPGALTVTATSTLATCGLANGIAACTASGGTSGYTYMWLPAGGANSTTTNNLTGNTTYTVVVKDANNCLDSASIYANQTPALTLSITATSSVTCNGGSNGSISASSSGSNNTTYLWMPSGQTTLNATNLTGSVSGTTYTLTGNDGGCKDSVTTTIIQSPTFTISVNNPTICVGQTATITASGANTYTWNTGENTATITKSPASTTVYTVNGQNNNGCTATPNSATVTVSSALTISVTPSNTTICQGASTTLNATSSGGGGGTNQYTWNPVSSSSASINVSPTATLTTYTVSVYNAVCAATASTTAQVGVYTNPTLSISATPTESCTSICVSFTASPGFASYNWNFGDGSTGTNASIGHCYYTAGDYDVHLTAITQNSCAVNTAKTNFIHVYGNPVADFTASSFTTTVNEGTISFTDLSITNIAHWNWTIDSIITNIQNPSHTFINEGVYPITLAVTDAHGCVDTVTKEVVIQSDFVFYAPNSLTPNGDGRNERFLPLGTGWDNTSFNMWIFDRWGNTILHTTDPNQGWDGTKHNEIVKEDVYVWKVSLYDIGGMPHEYHGQVSVIR